MPNPIPYKSFCWSIGTTSFRTKDFNRTIEEQLVLLDGFWHLAENRDRSWNGDAQLQARYYDYMQQHGFVRGDAGNRPKDAREKTSGLVDIGLVDGDRRLTPAGTSLLAICEGGDYTPDNLFQIPKDSYLYLKQLLKMHDRVNGDTVRPFIVLLYVLSRLDYLSAGEFTYLLPLCTNRENTEEIIAGIREVRAGTLRQDDIILRRLMEMNNYQDALALFLAGETDADLLCQIGLNRKSRQYDRAYFGLYQALHAFCLEGDEGALSRAYAATRAIKIGKWWRCYLFNTQSEAAIRSDPLACKRTTAFDGVRDERAFKTVFFQTMHLLKAKATLSDYLDLNRRYVRTTDVVLFEDDTVRLDVVPKHFFNTAIDALYPLAFTDTPLLVHDCPLEGIAPCLALDERVVIDSVNAELGTAVTTIADARDALEDIRYGRLQHLIDTRFTDDKLLTLLDLFAVRNDGEIRDMVTDNADVPTIFEYVLAILWYKVSERQGKVLDYMKLSLDADLLPKTHAAGGEADIVYEYPATEYYPAHTVLLEATLADGTNQRRMEMEPVSRHLGRYLISTRRMDSYCVFATNHLDINVISDFRSRKTTPYYDPQDYTRSVEGMKIIPIATAELKTILAHHRTYKELFPLFQAAYDAPLPPPQWYETCVKNAV